jgi:hypothetical protein
MRLRNTFGRIAALGAIAAGAVAMLPSTAAAAPLLVADGGPCAPQPSSKVFSRWGDKRDYMLAPGGSFEQGAPGWTLNRASIAAGNESYNVGGSGQRYSLRIDRGGTATSPPVCVGLEHPSIRFFAKNNRFLLSTMTVEVIVTTSLGLKVAVPIGLLLPHSKWKPSPGFLMIGNLLPLMPGEYTPVQFRFRSIGLGSWWIDDFYVDPRRRS